MKIPREIKAGLDRWVERGAPHPRLMGGFMRAVLMNDLNRAVVSADDENRAALVAIVQYVHNEVPALAHAAALRGMRPKEGDRRTFEQRASDLLDAWHDRGGLIGIATDIALGDMVAAEAE